MGRLASVPSLTIDIINNPHHLPLCSVFDKRIRNFKNVLAGIGNDPLSCSCFFPIIVNNLAKFSARYYRRGRQCYFKAKRI